MKTNDSGSWIVCGMFGDNGPDSVLIFVVERLDARKWNRYGQEW